MKELLKVICIYLYQILYWILSVCIKTHKYDVVIIAKHNNNVMNYVALYPEERVGAITDNAQFRQFLRQYPQTRGIVEYVAYNPFSIWRQVCMLLQTNKVVIDDYYPALFVLNKKVTVWNIWHSYAVYKKIGLASPVYSSKGKLTIRRYGRNFQRIDQLFVRSEIEAGIFEQAYHLSRDKIVIDPRFYASRYGKISRKKTKRKRIVYAPTFRPYAYDFIAVYERLQQQFSDYTVIATLHQKTLHDYPQMRRIHHTNPLPELLTDAEIFMTDYSGLLIEIADVYKDIDVYQVLDARDYVKYEQVSGLNDDMYDRGIPSVQIN